MSETVLKMPCPILVGHALRKVLESRTIGIISWNERSGARGPLDLDVLDTARPTAEDEAGPLSIPLSIYN